MNKTDPKELLKIADESIVRKEIYEVLKLRNSCNEAANLRKGTEIFKNTTKASDALLDTFYLIPNDKMTFGNFIDNLYVLFYEGAGSLRFLKNKGGFLEKEECEFIWCVKHLRNKWLRHDVDHGSEKKIKASKKELRNAFKWLGLDKYPIESEDFLYLHSSLIKELKGFLRNLLKNINN